MHRRLRVLRDAKRVYSVDIFDASHQLTPLVDDSLR